MANLISDLQLKFPVFVPQRNWLNLVLVILIFIPVMAVQPWFVEKIPLPITYWSQVLRYSPAGPLLSVNTPVSAAEYLRAHPGGNLFNEMGYGSYLIWALPDQKVFVDTRVELFPYKQWLDYIKINRGIDYNELLQVYGADRLLVDKELQTGLIDMLTNDESWNLEYDDQFSQVWSRVASP